MNAVIIVIKRLRKGEILSCFIHVKRGFVRLLPHIKFLGELQQTPYIALSYHSKRKLVDCKGGEMGGGHKNDVTVISMHFTINHSQIKYFVTREYFVNLKQACIYNIYNIYTAHIILTARIRAPILIRRFLPLDKEDFSDVRKLDNLLETDDFMSRLQKTSS